MFLLKIFTYKFLENARDTNFFATNFINCWWWVVIGKWKNNVNSESRWRL